MQKKTKSLSQIRSWDSDSTILVSMLGKSTTRFRKHLFSVWLCIAFFINACTLQSETPEKVDIILFGGSIRTMDPNNPTAAAVAIRDNTIVAVGADADIENLAGANTKLVNLKGNSVTPGFIDTHNHFAWGALGENSSLDIEFPAVKSIGDILSKLQTAAARLEPDAWITGSNWDAGKLVENRDLTASDLDAVAPDNPVWLLHTSAHYGVANSKALELANITEHTPDLSGGVIVRDADGYPTGILTDQAMSLVTDITPPVSTADFVAAITANVGDLNAVGITTIKDPEIDQRHWDAYSTVYGNNDLSVRVFALWRAPDSISEAKSLLERITPITQPREESSSDELMSGGVKIYVDGSGTARTAWMYADWNENFEDVDAGNTGLTYIDSGIIREQMQLFHDAGIHIGTHAIGDRAIDFTVDTYAQVANTNPIHGLRHSIIHSNLPTEHALQQMFNLQTQHDAAYPEVQPAFLWWIGDVYAGNFGAARSQRVLPLNTFENRGIRWAGSSDYDVSPFAPAIALWAAATRQTMLGTYGDSPWGSDESVGVDATIRAYTSTAARQVFLEDKVGTIEVGKLADIVVWDRNLYLTPVATLKDAATVDDNYER